MEENRTDERIQHLERRVARLEQIIKVSRVINSTLNLEPLLHNIIQIATDLTATEASSILLLDKKTGELHFEIATGVKGQEVKSIVVPLDDSIAGWVVKEGEPLLIPDVRKDPRHYHRADDITQFSTRSILGVPLQVKDKVIGVLEVLNKMDDEEFTPSDVETLTILAAQAAIAIENARLFQQSDLLSEMVHELRTPLTSIRGYSKMLLLAEDIDQEKKQEFAETIHREAVRLGQMINDFLDLARLESGRTYMAHEPVNMSEVISETLAILQPQAAERQISIPLQVPEILPTLIGDVDRLKQVMVNLVSNAVKYNREGGQVDIEVQVGEDELNVAVRDTGWGIAEEDLPHIFEKFYRVNDPEQQTKGTGLGLSITKHIIEAHGGTISVQSAKGQGSTFAFVLPLPEGT
ncbi:MAG: GAF domain-containing protein [Anaerolineales bacterium]|nr:MAG: GAF domain-containing protein [Anaerolineales bacterium]